MIQVIKKIVMFHLLMTSSISAIERKLAGTVITLFIQLHGNEDDNNKAGVAVRK